MFRDRCQERLSLGFASHLRWIIATLFESGRTSPSNVNYLTISRIHHWHHQGYSNILICFRKLDRCLTICMAGQDDKADEGQEDLAKSQQQVFHREASLGHHFGRNPSSHF